MKRYNIFIKKAIAIFCFIFFIFISLIIHNFQVTGYELSIYTNIPSLLWALLIFNICAGIFIIVHQTLCEEKSKNSRFWLVGFLILLICNFIILSLYIWKGYYIYGRSDILSHLGAVRNAIINNHIDDDVCYPITHLLVAILSKISGHEYVSFSRYIHIYFSIMYFFFIYCLSKSVFHDEKYSKLSVAASVPIFYSQFQTGMYPHLLATLTLPLIYYIYLKTLNKKLVNFRILFVLLLIMYPFFHPIVSLNLIYIFIIIEISKVMCFVLKTGSFSNVKKIKISTNHIFISIVLFSMWILSFKDFRYNIRYLYNWINGEARNIVQITSTEEKLTKLDMQLVDIVELFMKMVGDEFIYTMLSFIAVLIILKRLKSNILKKELYIISITFISGILLSIVFFVSYKIHNPLRIMNLDFNIVLTPLFVGFILSELHTKYKLRKNKLNFNPIIPISILIIVLPATIGMFSLYSSPYINQPTNQVTLKEVKGMAWLFEYKNREIKTIETTTRVDRFADLILGNLWEVKRTDISDRFDTERKIPDHFNYTYYRTLGDSLKHDKYAVISKYDRMIYSTVWKAVGRFNKNDYNRLNNDKTVNNIYSNGEFDTYFVHSTRKLKKEV